MRSVSTAMAVDVMIATTRIAAIATPAFRKPDGPTALRQ
jgi:hypothetical protein